MAREIDITDADGLTVYATVRRQSDDKFWNAAASAMETFNAAHWTSADYCIALTKTVRSAGALANYAADFPSGIADGQYVVELYEQSGGAPNIAADTFVQGTTFWWSGSAQIPGGVDPTVIADAVNSELTSSKGEGPWGGIQVVGAAPTAGNPATVNTDFEVPTGIYWQQQITASGLDSTGWTKMVLTIKADSHEDTDDEALICVRVTNPGDAGTDGLLVLKASQAADKTLGSLAVTAISPDTSVTWTLQAGAMDIPPSGTSSYNWELTRFIGTKKERIGTGSLTADRSLRRSVTAP